MQVVLGADSDGGAAAQTGSLVHAAADAYHKTKASEEERVAAGKAALEAAREKFPEGDPARAHEIFGSYTRDPENRDAEVLWSEEPVRLVLPADRGDPTGQPIVIAGTLDQVRRKVGRKKVHDIKTGTFYTPHDQVFEYMIQQAVYTLAAIETLDKDIEPGGLICTVGYIRSRGTVHIENPFNVEQARDLILMVPLLVAAVRRGEPVFHPGLEACKWCDVKKAGDPWPKCHTRFRSIYG